MQNKISSISEQSSKGITSLRDLWRRLQAGIVGDVPERDALCEFDCRKRQCTVGDWNTCERRLREEKCREEVERLCGTPNFTICNARHTEA